MCNNKTKRYQLVEIQVPSGTTKTQFFFPDLPNLTGRDGYPVRIKSIVSYTNSTLPKSPSNASNVSNDDFEQSFLTLIKGDTQILYNTPLVELSYVGSLGDAENPRGLVDNQPVMADVENISWTKCYIQKAGAAPTGSTSYCVGVYYEVWNPSKQIWE